MGLVAVDEDFFVVVRVAGGSTRVLLSDVTAADEWELAASAVDFLGLPEPRDPARAARDGLKPALPRRFYKEAGLAEGEGGYVLVLDGRPARTPAKRPLRIGDEAVARALADEWQDQRDEIDPSTMPLTRLANTAIDGVADRMADVAEETARYAGSDLLCYFAEAPEALVQRQEAHWGPVLRRAEEEIALAFVRAARTRHQAQPEATLARVKTLALESHDFGLAGLAFGAALFGSAILALALQRGWLNGEQAHALSRVDEAFQEEKWGIDEEAAERTARLLGEARMLERWLRALD